MAVNPSEWCSNTKPWPPCFRPGLASLWPFVCCGSMAAEQAWARGIWPHHVSCLRCFRLKALIWGIFETGLTRWPWAFGSPPNQCSSVLWLVVWFRSWQVLNQLVSQRPTARCIRVHHVGLPPGPWHLGPYRQGPPAAGGEGAYPLSPGDRWGKASKLGEERGHGVHARYWTSTICRGAARSWFWGHGDLAWDRGGTYAGHWDASRAYREAEATSARCRQSFYGRHELNDPDASCFSGPATPGQRLFTQPVQPDSGAVELAAGETARHRCGRWPFLQEVLHVGALCEGLVPNVYALALQGLGYWWGRRRRSFQFPGTSQASGKIHHGGWQCSCWNPRHSKVGAHVATTGHAPCWIWPEARILRPGWKRFSSKFWRSGWGKASPKRWKMPGSWCLASWLPPCMVVTWWPQPSWRPKKSKSLCHRWKIIHLQLPLLAVILRAKPPARPHLKMRSKRIKPLIAATPKFSASIQRAVSRWPHPDDWAKSAAGWWVTLLGCILSSVSKHQLTCTVFQLLRPYGSRRLQERRAPHRSESRLAPCAQLLFSFLSRKWLVSSARAAQRGASVHSCKDRHKNWSREHRRKHVAAQKQWWIIQDWQTVKVFLSRNLWKPATLHTRWMFWCQALAAWAGNHGMLISFQEIQCFDRVNDLQFLHHVKLWRRISFLKGNAFPVAAVHSEAKTKNWVSQVPSARQKWKYNLWIKTGWRFGTFFYFPIYWEESSQLTNIFQRGWNHQPEELMSVQQTPLDPTGRSKGIADERALQIGPFISPLW